MFKAKLRTCASCEWIFKLDDPMKSQMCPKCGFGHYSARYVYGNKAYRYAKTQQPWYDKKMADYSYKLRQEINAALFVQQMKQTVQLSLTNRLAKPGVFK